MTADGTIGRRQAVLRAEITQAAAIVAPQWPLRTFVAVNPLGGLTDFSFDEACALARRWLGARTHLPFDEYRQLLARGAVREADVRRAVAEVAPAAAAAPAVVVGYRSVPAVDVVLADLLHGPEPAPSPAVPTAGQRREPGLGDDVGEAIDELVAAWCAAFVDEAAATWTMPGRGVGLYAAWRELAPADRRLRRLVGAQGCRWVADAPAVAEDALLAAIETLGVADADRCDEMRAQLARLPGWAGYSRWVGEWAPYDREGPTLRLVDLLAVRATVEAAVVRRLPTAVPTAPERWAEQSVAETESSVQRRVAAIVGALGGAGDVRIAEQVAAIVRLVPESVRAATWLAAHERSFMDRLLAALPTTRVHADAANGAPAAGASERTAGRSVPDVQAVFCIDARSEGLRRHMEAQGRYETLGFAGFFGVPVRWRPLGSTSSEARCPVLVTPTREVVERSAAAADAVARYHGRQRAVGAARGAFHAAKGGAMSPFALAEVAGWLAGPMAAARTLVPSRRATGWRERFRRPLPTDPAVDGDPGTGSGLSLDERVMFAEAMLSTMGLVTGFAPLVLLCGHGSRTVNNPHASALDCGACGGAPGGASARVAAAILNDRKVRDGLVERGIVIPADTWFTAAEHDTASDRVTLLDRHAVPTIHARRVAMLERDLSRAGEALALERAARLPGRVTKVRAGVRARGRDWAQVRPEWGLAGNAAFVIGPRSITRDIDLACRVFLHSYDAEGDADGVALETIMTAPLVVAQWISAQYYFSSVDPERFGAGDKMLHNPVGGVGVVLGEGGDLQVGLPIQSVAAGPWRMHEPLRLLAVVQARPERIDAVLARNPMVADLVDGRWVTIAARASVRDEWTVRRADGGWSTWSRPEEEHEDAGWSLEVTR